MFKVKGEFVKSERIYCIKKGKLFQHLFNDDSNFKRLFAKILRIVDYMSCVKGIVHCDIKPDNILLEYDPNSEFDKPLNFDTLKLIDFGSAFRVDSPENFSSNTPEYMPPEITELLEKNMSNKEIASFLKYLVKYPYAIDIWSLGVMILEMLLSCPVWMSYKSKTVINGKVPQLIINNLIRSL